MEESKIMASLRRILAVLSDNNVMSELPQKCEEVINILTAGRNDICTSAEGLKKILVDTQSLLQLLNPNYIAMQLEEDCTAIANNSGNYSNSINNRASIRGSIQSSNNHETMIISDIILRDSTIPLADEQPPEMIGEKTLQQRSIAECDTDKTLATLETTQALSETMTAKKKLTKYEEILAKSSYCGINENGECRVRINSRSSSAISRSLSRGANNESANKSSNNCVVDLWGTKRLKIGLTQGSQRNLATSLLATYVDPVTVEDDNDILIEPKKSTKGGMSSSSVANAVDSNYFDQKYNKNMQKYNTDVIDNPLGLDDGLSATEMVIPLDLQLDKVHVISDASRQNQDCEPTQSPCVNFPADSALINKDNNENRRQQGKKAKTPLLNHKVELTNEEEKQTYETAVIKFYTDKEINAIRRYRERMAKTNIEKKICPKSESMYFSVAPLNQANKTETLVAKKVSKSLATGELKF